MHDRASLSITVVVRSSIDDRLQCEQGEHMVSVGDDGVGIKDPKKSMRSLGPYLGAYPSRIAILITLLLRKRSIPGQQAATLHSCALYAFMR